MERLLMEDGHVYIPLFLLANRERDAVVEDLARQFKEVHTVVARAASAAGCSPRVDEVSEPDHARDLRGEELDESLMEP